tara:strand:- start:221 stop:475 length:255 start_codon:yes stop_codon:yes gene_type:complete
MENEDKKYRVREFNDNFTIQVGFLEKTGVLWWSRKDWVWYETWESGNPKPKFPTVHIPKSYPYTSLREAKVRIERWEQGEVFHY